MGWFSGQMTLSDFARDHGNAVVVVSDTDSDIVAAVYEVGSLVCKIYATQHVKVTEYRALTYDLAVSLKGNVARGSKAALRTKCGDSWAVVPMLIGTERTAAISRTNEAGGYKLTVTETTIALATAGEIACSAGTPVTNGDVRVSWETGTSA